MRNFLQIEFNDTYEIPTFNKKWFTRITANEYQNKIKSHAVSGKPTKVWKDILKRFFKNKWNILFLSIILAIAFYLVFGNFFTNFTSDKSVKDLDRSAVQFLRPSWNRVPSEYTGRLSDISNDVNSNIAYDKVNNILTGPPNMIIASSFDQSSGMWTIKYNDLNYVPTVLGTDSVGVSVYSRLITSARFSIGLAFTVAIIETIVGTIVGLYLGYHAGKALDTYMMRVIETITAIPALLLMIILVIVLGSGFSMMLISLIIIGWVGPVYVARMFTIKVKDAEFINASRAIGASQHRIIFKHILPNILGRILVSFVNRIPRIIFIESTLVFLGFSIGGDLRNSLGNMFHESRTIEAIQSNPWFLTSTTLILLFFTLSLQILSNGLRDAFDAKVSG